MCGDYVRDGTTTDTISQATMDQKDAVQTSNSHLLTDRETTTTTTISFSFVKVRFVVY
jgi:hypothetical protein